MTSRTLSVILSLALIAPVATLTAQARAGAPPAQATRVLAAPTAPLPVPDMSSTNAINPPSPDPRIGLAPAANGQPSGEAIWNMKHLSNTPPSPASANATHSDLAFKGPYVFQGNYNGFEVWDITNPVAPRLMASPTCPASQDDISVYGNLLFLSAEATNSRTDCGTTGAPGASNPDRMRGIRIFDISDVRHPALITQVQSCRGSHTHTLLTDPNDKANIYVYISGTSGVRPSTEVAKCTPNPLDPNTALFNIEIIKVPLANPKAASIVSHARIFSDSNRYFALPSNLSGHGLSPADTAEGGGRRGRGGGGRGRGGAPGGRGADPAAPPAPPVPVPVLFVRPGPSGRPPLVTEITPRVDGMAIDSAGLQKSTDSLVAAGWTRVPAAGGGGRGGRGGGRGAGGALGGGRGAGGAPAPVDSLVLKGRAAMALVKPLDSLVRGDTARWVKTTDSLRRMGLDIPFLPAPRGVLTQCHDITVYPGVGYAGGACAGMGLLLDIRDPANPKRLDAVADTNFSYWHSATFSNDGSKVLFSDEWGGGGAAYCRALDPLQWGANAIFTIEKNKMIHKSYYKMPAAQTPQETCVAHNGNLIPVPGREIMVQSFYQGGITVFEWTDPANPKEIAFFDRGPGSGGYWSSYYYNGYIIGSEIRRGMDIFELTPSPFLSQNELDAAKLIQLDWLNPQDQPKFVWPANISVVRSYLDQLVRWNGIAADRSTAISAELDKAMSVSGAERKAALTRIAAMMDVDARTAKDSGRVTAMAKATRDLAASVR